MKENLSHINVIIFDWSGVISDDRLPVYESNMQLLDKYHVPRMTFAEWLPKTRLNAPEFLADHGVAVEPQVLFEEYSQLYAAVRLEGINPTIYPGTEEVLTQLNLQGRRLLVMSSHPENSLIDEAEKYGITKHFEDIVGNIRNKTTGLIGLYTGKNIPRRNSIYLGDTIFDIQAAKQAEVYSCGITTGYHTKERLVQENPDILIDSLTELILHLT